MANELDELMDKISEDPLLATAEDIDKIIKLHRAARANWEAGVKAKKGSAEGEVKIDLVELGLVPPKVQGTPLKRI